MNHERETERVMMNVRTAGRALKTMFWINSPATMFLMTFFKRLVKQKLLKAGEYIKIEKFIKATNGNYTIVNVPTAKEGAIKTYWEKSDMAKELNGMRCAFTVLPDLNRSDGVIQIAVADKDKEKFGAWFSQYIVSQMQGGEKTMGNLKNLTEGNMSIISMPFEGKGPVFQEDFQKLGINYSVLPDLNVGDQQIQLFVANADLQKVQYWYAAYKDDCMKRGESVSEMSVVNAVQYMQTGQMSEENYVKTGDDKVLAANALYEGREASELEHQVNHVSNKIKTIDDTAYEELHNNPEFVEITINSESLIDNSIVAKNQAAEERGFFASRIPGTYGEKEQTLVLSTEHIFSTDEGKTYIAFMERDQKPIVLDVTAKPISKSERKSGQALFEHYDEVGRRFKNKSKIKGTEESLEQLNKIAPEKIPSNPLKAR